MSHHQESMRHKSNHPFLHESHNSYPHTQTPHGVYQDHQTINITDLPMESSIPPQTSLSSRAFNSGSNFIDFEIPRGSINILKSVTLCMEIVNPDLTNKLMLPVSYNLIDRIEIYFGSTLVETVLSEGLYINHCTNRSEAQLEILANSTCVDPNSFDNHSLYSMVDANGTETKELYVRLYSLLTTSNLFLPGIVEDIRLRVHFCAYSKWKMPSITAVYTAPTETPVLQKVELRVQHVVLNQSNYNKLQTLYRNNQINIKYLDHRFQSYSVNAQANVSINHVLSSINGLISHMYILMRNQNPTGLSITDYQKINRYYIADSSGSSITNGIQYSDEYARGPYSSDHFEHSKFFSVKRVYPICFSNDVFTSINTANNMGSRMFSSMEQLYFTPGSTGSYELLILCYAHSIMHIKNGQISISRS